MELHVSTNPGHGGHSDLFLKIPLLGVDVSADTYYFVLAIEDRQDLVNAQDVRRGIVGLLQYWQEQTSACGDRRTIYLPFDFSDQYTGCLQVVANGLNVQLCYGFSLIEGWRVNPLNPAMYCHEVTDFKAHNSGMIELPRQQFIDALCLAIAEVERAGVSIQ